jgi:hypothetical protein
MQRCRRSRVASHHDQFCALIQQEARDRPGEIAHLLDRTRPIRDMSLVTKIDDRFFGHQLTHGAQHGQAAHARVEHTDWLALLGHILIFSLPLLQML